MCVCVCVCVCLLPFQNNTNNNRLTAFSSCKLQHVFHSENSLDPKGYLSVCGTHSNLRFTASSFLSQTTRSMPTASSHMYNFYSNSQTGASFGRRVHKTKTNKQTKTTTKTKTKKHRKTVLLLVQAFMFTL